MTKVRLTERRIRDLKHDPDAIKFAWDAGLPGFGVRISKGDTRAYVLWTRSGSKKSLLTLGRVGEMTLDNARAMASSELDQIERGGADLTARRADAKSAMTVAQGCQWFLAVHVPRRIALEKMSPRTAVDYRQQTSRYISPLLGYLKIADVERKHVERMLDKVGADKPVQFARVRSLTRSMFNRFRAEGWATQENPARDIAVPTERARERVLTADEQSVFLPALARCKQVHGNRFVFPGGRGGDEPVGPRPIRRIFHAARKAAGLENVRVHDLRRTAIVDALSAGVPISIVARMAGHSSVIMTSRYAKHADPQVHEGAEQMAAARREKRGADVLPFEARRA